MNFRSTGASARVVLLAFTLVATFLFFYGLVILGAVMSFWTTESLEIMNMLTYGGVETAQYPMAIYQKYFQRFFTFVVPLAMVTYFPILAILGHPGSARHDAGDADVGAHRRIRVLRRGPCCCGASAYATTRRQVRNVRLAGRGRVLFPRNTALGPLSFQAEIPL